MEAVAGPRADVLVCRLRLAVADAEVLEPAFELVGGAGQMIADPGRLAADPGEDQVSGEEAGGDDPHQDQAGADEPRHPAALEQGDQGLRHGRDHPGDEQGDEDHVSQREEPYDPDEQQNHADQKPCREARIAKPARGGEETRELARIDLDELVAIVAVGTTAKAPPNHRANPFMMGT